MRDTYEIFQMFGAILVGILVLAAAIVFFAWLMQDAESRGKSGCLVCLLVLFMQVPGFVLWLIFRPEKTPQDRMPDQ